jgi:hypothetical protein
MTAASATSPSYISADDPQFNQPEESFAACELNDDLKWVIASRYRHLDPDIKLAIVLLWENEHIAAAQALADCGKYCSVLAYCKKKNAARAHRHTCHLWIHPFCGKPVNLMRCWLRWRSSEVRELRQWGVEIRGPLGSNMRDKASKIGRWLKDKGISSANRPVIEPKPRYEAVRIVVRQDRSPFAEVKAYLHKITKDAVGYSAFTFYDASPPRVIEWMMASTASVLEACGHVRARLYLQWYRKQLTRTYGDFYKEINEEQLPCEIEELETTHGDIRCDCGECDGVMVVIPWAERHTQSIESAEEEYKNHIAWTSCKDSFRLRRNSHKGQLMTESTEVVTQGAIATPSPPS